MNINILDIFWNKVSLWVIGKPYLFKLPDYQWEYKTLSSKSIKDLSQKIWKKIIIWNQFHSSEINILDEYNKNILPVCDALITQLSDVAIFVLASDCVPILLYDEQGWYIWAIHAGRKWLENSIILTTLNKFPWDTDQIQAFIGPCISWKNYELGYEEIKNFQASFSEYIKQPERWVWKYYLDIRSIAYKQLLYSWIEKDNISISSECTYENTEKYHSYRRHTHNAEYPYGNNAFGIWFNN